MNSIFPILCTIHLTCITGQRNQRLQDSTAKKRKERAGGTFEATGICIKKPKKTQV